MASEHGTLIFVGTFLAVFVLMISQIPSIFYAYQTYVPEGYAGLSIDDKWDIANIGKSGVKSYDNKTLLCGVPNWFALNYTGNPINDTLLYWVWDPYENIITIDHVPAWWNYHICNPYPLTRAYVLANEENNVSAFYVRCTYADIPEVYTQISFDSNTYSSLSSAWDDGTIQVWVGFLMNASATSASYDVWTLLGGILFFQSPNIEPTLNAIIAIPIWISIIVCIIYVLDKVMPF